ncbi:hypothetical protein [Halomicronema hongdechloris]|nr:hypothetical protein [Halomicronema hongdechloris]
MATMTMASLPLRLDAVFTGQTFVEVPQSAPVLYHGDIMTLPDVQAIV